MRYIIDTIMIEDYLWRGVVEVLDDVQGYDDECVVITGETTIACESSTEAQEYMERVFLPDLRANFPRIIGNLVFDWEVLPDDDPTETGLD